MSMTTAGISMLQTLDQHNSFFQKFGSFGTIHIVWSQKYPKFSQVHPEILSSASCVRPLAMVIDMQQREFYIHVNRTQVIDLQGKWHGWDSCSCNIHPYASASRLDNSLTFFFAQIDSKVFVGSFR